MSVALPTRNVLVFPAGTEIGLEIHAALRSCKEVRLHAAGNAESNHALFAYPEYHYVPDVREAGWLPCLVELCRRLEISHIFPAHDDALLALMRASGEIPARIVTSPLATCEIARSKSATYARLAGKIRVPRIYPSADAVERFPVFVKPDRGQGSQGAVRAQDRDALACALRGMAAPLICEYFPGEEYTVDCFSDRERGLLFAGARRRARTRAGIAVHTRVEALPEARELAEAIAGELEFHGAWFFQLKRTADGTLGLLEVAPRIAGSMASHRVLGINFPLLSLYECERTPVALLVNTTPLEMDRALANRYRHNIEFSAAYLDLDDTLLVGNVVNLDVLSFVFFCINSGKPIYLITRHRGDLAAVLARHRLAGLFDKIIHLEGTERKSDYIREPDAVFVDDSFAERVEVWQRHGIPTFDCSMLEMFVKQAAAPTRI